MKHSFHARNGLFFLTNGDSVRVVKTLDGLAIREGGDGNIVVDITLPREEWESMVRCMAQPCSFRDDGLEARAAFRDAQARMYPGRVCEPPFISPFNDAKNGG